MSLAELGAAIMGRPDAGSIEPTASLRFGTVTQVSPLLVQVGAALSGQPCNKLGSYSPVVGDYVMVAVMGADRMVVGSMTAGVHNGVSGSRPTAGNFVGDTYIDSTLGQVFYWDGSAWRGTKTKTFNAVSGGVGGITGTETVVNTLTIPDQKCAGQLFVASEAWMSKTVVTDDFWHRHRLTNLAGAELQVKGDQSTGDIGLTMSHLQTMAGGAAVTVVRTVIRNSGTGTISNVFASTTSNFINALFIPT